MTTLIYLFLLHSNQQPHTKWLRLTDDDCCCCCCCTSLFANKKKNWQLTANTDSQTDTHSERHRQQKTTERYILGTSYFLKPLLPFSYQIFFFFENPLKKKKKAQKKYCFLLFVLEIADNNWKEQKNSIWRIYGSSTDLIISSFIFSSFYTKKKTLF